jgi:hypothetical protein
MRMGLRGGESTNLWALSSEMGMPGKALLPAKGVVGHMALCLKARGQRQYHTIAGLHKRKSTRTEKNQSNYWHARTEIHAIVCQHWISGASQSLPT